MITRVFPCIRHFHAIFVVKLVPVNGMVMSICSVPILAWLPEIALPAILRRPASAGRRMPPNKPEPGNNHCLPPGRS